MNVASMKYLIWSNEHMAWWGPGQRGYVQIISCAGRYHRDVAAQIVYGANRYMDEGAEPNEVLMLAPECLGALTDA